MTLATAGVLVVVLLRTPLETRHSIATLVRPAVDGSRPDQPPTQWPERLQDEARALNTSPRIHAEEACPDHARLEAEITALRLSLEDADLRLRLCQQGCGPRTWRTIVELPWVAVADDAAKEVLRRAVQTLPIAWTDDELRIILEDGRTRTELYDFTTWLFGFAGPRRAWSELTMSGKAYLWTCHDDERLAQLLAMPSAEVQAMRAQLLDMGLSDNTAALGY